LKKDLSQQYFSWLSSILEIWWNESENKNIRSKQMSEEKLVEIYDT
jgi:hypothetical protein